MKSLVALALVCSLSSLSAFAGDGRISGRDLTKMGLQGMKTMTDEDGMKIRGLNVAAGGFSVASVPGAAGSSHYYANGADSASGLSVSAASLTVNHHTTFVFAGGGSSASH
jgi:hypothetical protein